MFKKGDVVKRRNGELFSGDRLTLVVDYIREDGNVVFEGGTHIISKDIMLADDSSGVYDSIVQYAVASESSGQAYNKLVVEVGLGAGIDNRDEFEVHCRAGEDAYMEAFHGDDPTAKKKSGDWKYRTCLVTRLLMVYHCSLMVRCKGRPRLRGQLRKPKIFSLMIRATMIRQSSSSIHCERYGISCYPLRKNSLTLP